MLFDSQTNPRTLQKAAWAIYSGDYADLIREILRRRFETLDGFQEYARYINPKYNVLRRVAHVLAVVYRRPPRRYAVDAEGAEDALRDYVRDLDTVLEEVSRMVFALGDVVVMPYWDEYDRAIKFDVIPPHYVISAEYDKSSLRSITIDQDAGEVTYYHDGTAEIRAKRRIDGRKGRLLDMVDTRLERLPVVVFSSGPRDYKKPWGIAENADLINGTLEIGVLETYHARTSLYRSFRAPTITATELLDATGAANPPDVRIGPSEIVPYNLQTVELADPADPFWDSIVKQIEALAAMRDISPTLILRKVAKLDEVRAASEELRNRWEAQVKIFRGHEGRLLDLIFAILRREGVWEKDLPEWQIDYMLPHPTLSDPQKALDVLERGVKLGVDSPAQFLLRENPDIKDYDAAWTWIQRNIDDRAKLVEKMRELNMPAEPGAPGATPQENGAMGPVARDNAGCNGPPAAPPELTKEV